MIESIYTGALHVVRLALPLLGLGTGKLARGIRGRRGSVDRIAGWAASNRDPGRRLVWFHAPSVGEGLQAKAIIEALRELAPQTRIVYTFFSPSAVSFAQTMPVDFADFLPLDLPGEVARLFDALVPDLVAFTKSEVWPNVTREAELRGVPVVLLSATLPESSSRLRGPAKALLTPAHRRLSAVGAISAGDARRFESLGVAPDRIRILGDARYDQVSARAHRPAADPALLDSLAAADGIVIVAGSTWPPDEDRLVPAFAAMTTGSRPQARLVLVPHEPTEAHLSRIEEQLFAEGLGFARLSDAAGVTTRPPVVIVDRVGILGDLYRIADIAYVGGGFGDAGLHSVLEPAAFGAPVIFGPNHRNAREAGELVESGGAQVVGDQRQLADALGRWVDLVDERLSAGAAARAHVDIGLGAAGRSAELILGLLATRGLGNESDRP